MGQSSRPLREGFSMEELITIVTDATIEVRSKIQDIQARASAISIGDMFDVQMLMNQLSQLTEMSTSVVAAVNNAIQSIASKISR
ncbi:MAG: hypothetical protein Tsb0021_12830 [Chlamydiales bacterium]